jgi:hypothetical protein
MTYEPITTTFEKGKVVLPPDVDWPDGITVQVQPMEEELPTLAELFKDWIGIVHDMPSDLAENHDHDIHGTPKKQ